MPYLTCTPYATTVLQPTEFKVVIDSGTPGYSPAQKQADNSVRLYYNVTNVSTGNHSAVVTAVLVDSAWGRLESPASDPFAFTKPSAPGKTIGLAIVP